MIAMATFYRRLQTNSVIRVVRVSLVDLVTAIILSVCIWLGTEQCLMLYELDFTGIILIPFGTALITFIKFCSWFRKDGDGVLRKDGRFRYLASRRINRILIPDSHKADELFVVIQDIFKIRRPFKLALIFAFLTGNNDLKQQDTNTQWLPGTSFCLNIKRSNK